MDKDEVEDGEGAVAVVVLAGGSLVDVWADGAIAEIVLEGCTIGGVIVLDVVAFGAWWVIAVGVAVLTATGANVVVL